MLPARTCDGEDTMKLLNAGFKYTPSSSTNIEATWKRYGYKPTTDAERLARQRRTLARPVNPRLERKSVNAAG
jgi:hypothetical protein